MIPRFKPAIGPAELGAILRPGPAADATGAFEREFASAFGAREGVAFNSGRGALFALLNALEITGAEIVIPAYTCSVVAYAVSVSGNRPVFVDAEATGYNMDLDQLESAITPQTAMVIPTHVFGFPADVDRVSEIVRRAEQRYGRKIWILQDCAHAFGATWRGRRVSEAGDAALFGLGISKMMTSIFGGMLTTNDPALAARVREWRSTNSPSPTVGASLEHRAYLAAVATAFSAPVYGAVRWLQDETTLLDGMTKAYHMDGQIRLPADATHQMPPVDAAVGRMQLVRYPQFEERRRRHARVYREQLSLPAGWRMPVDDEGATYSHFPIHVPDRERTIRDFLAAGIQLGRLIEYSVPHLAEYGGASPSRYPNSWSHSEHTINLPVHPDLSDRDQARIVERINELSPVAMAASAAH
ncbi:MAG TPA: aminotransferase class I/II-fold pyridoxal phosphate-dependent enzyme [Vicinamibacterales bacterium]|nr:aminotransferase class I/II-fold pyridoxal phosphate-dependent enzyme [Vicinamibacterales bacterium]